MSWWNAKYPNNHDEFEVTFGSKYRERAKAVEKVCQAVIDKKVKSPDDVAAVVRCRECKHYKERKEISMKCCYVHLLTPHPMGEDDFCSYGERKDGAE